VASVLVALGMGISFVLDLPVPITTENNF